MNEQIKKLKNSKVLNILLSVLIACVVWVYVDNVTKPDINDTLRNVPITIIGQETLKNKDLVLTAQSVKDIDLRLTGKRDELMNLNQQNVMVSADVSSITEAGSYDLACAITLPTSITGGRVTVNNPETYRVTVTVEERLEKQVEVRGVFSGTVAKGYQGGEFRISRKQISIAGPKSLIERIEYAQVELTGNGLKESYVGHLNFELMTGEGATISINQVESEVTSVYVVYPVYMLKDLQLTVDFIEGGGAALENVKVDIFPKSILVSGDEEYLEQLESISLGNIPLVEIAGNTILNLPIALPEYLTNESGVKEARVAVSFEEVAVRTLEVSRFEIINIPEAYTAGMITTSVSVVVRGAQEEIQQLRADQMYVRIDLAEVDPVEGELEAFAKVILPELESVGVVGTAYTARVALTR